MLDVPTGDDNELPAVGALRRHKGLFYTGGVDSLFSLIMRGRDVDVLVKAIFDWNDEEELLRTLKSQPKEAFGRPQLTVGTNVLHPFPEFADAWSYLTHGPALGANGHLFFKQISHLIFSSSISYGDLIPWGSHPLTDPLLSSTTLQFDHYGAAYTRVEKVLRVAQSIEHVGYLDVCSQPPSKKAQEFINCSRCQKCLRTMASIEISGIDLSVAKSFDWSDYKFDKLRNIRLYHPNEYIMFREILEGALLKGRSDIAEVVRLTMAKSGKYSLVAAAEDYMRRRFPSLVSQRPIFRSAKRAFMKLAPH